MRVMSARLCEVSVEGEPPECHAGAARYNGASTVVRISDRGPAKRDRVIDLSGARSSWSDRRVAGGTMNDTSGVVTEREDTWG